MKKRSMLAVASLVAGTAIAALSPAPPAAQAATPDGTSSSADVTDSAETLESGGGEAAADA
ncbi:hypothetical protein E2C00_21570 [Streptomyces sp. WAC05374]|uniref:hypothetical protein n=1 Tax=Streptomyces sp. WAC05374 TaxID=2487420 RepID=UPI000F87A389|nr:hypothetical protein [Streptomyces sp. WAC05374]RST05047.1 hypothetical protein EF905_33245 [Streptomyces sp. WAC05374]TDF45874.1 hypothetical protein E2B92_10575 [Streptomyces sp. WAC05374]TDF48116.1 hypothetical protein E2C02_28860 [Streptomyces sp. WAC05374]TDF52869.1 hypothetical protein E2C00_21570 [Streptomyces sp. WAC05374]